MKYRILKVDYYNESHYELQVKKFIFWVTEKDGGCDEIGLYEYTRIFKSKEEAKEFFKKCYCAPKKVVVEIGSSL